MSRQAGRRPSGDRAVAGLDRLVSRCLSRSNSYPFTGFVGCGGALEVLGGDFGALGHHVDSRGGAGSELAVGVGGIGPDGEAVLMGCAIADDGGLGRVDHPPKPSM